MVRTRVFRALALAALLLLPVAPLTKSAIADDDDEATAPVVWSREFPKTDFSKRAVPLSEITSGGPSRDGIPPIDRPRFLPVDEVRAVRDREPVIVVDLNGDARAYPIQILVWHEIVNDTVGGVPVAVTYCPLCASGIVFDRRAGSWVLDFGTTGRLRHSDLVMYDRQTESWWQQFTGEAIIGQLTGLRLDMLPAATMPMGRFRAWHPDGRVLVPRDPNLRRYGATPYAGYDTAARPMLYGGAMPEGIAPLARVAVVEGTAYALDLIRARGTLRDGDLILTHIDDMASPLDAPHVARGRDIGAVTVERVGPDGSRAAVPYHIAFAFAFHAFNPEGRIVTEASE
jgi:hypothetical protein